jgi:hypothetical protein
MLNLTKYDTRVVEPGDVRAMVGMQKRVLVGLFVASLLAALAVVVFAQVTAAQSGGDAPDPPADVPAVIEDDAERGNVESNDDAVSNGDDAGDALSKDTPAEQWQWLSSLIVPVIVQTLKRRNWTAEAKTGLLIVVAFVVTLIGSWTRGELDNFAFTSTALMQIAATSWVAYQIMDRLPVIGSGMNKLADVPSPFPPRKAP